MHGNHLNKINSDNPLDRTPKSSKSSNVDPSTFLTQNQEIPFDQAEMKLELHKG